MKIRELGIGLAVAAIGLVVTLGLVEIIFRIAQRFTTTEPVASGRPPYYFAHESSPTLQDYPYAAEKPADVFRIAVVGDSYSFAPYMQFTDAFPKVLERMLNLRNGSRRVEVINYGVPAYSTSHEIAVVEQALRENADLILLQITLNDPEIKPYRPIGITNFDTWGRLKTTGWKKALLENWQSLAFVFTRLHNEQTRRDYINYFNKLFERRATWNNFKTSIESIATKSRQGETPLVAVLLPLFGVPLNNSYPFHPVHQKIGALMDQSKVPFLDTYSRYHGIPIDRIQVIPGEDRHPNEIGHRIAAEAIYDWLAINKFIPEDLLITKKYIKRTQIKDEAPL